MQLEPVRLYYINSNIPTSNKQPDFEFTVPMFKRWDYRNKLAIFLSFLPITPYVSSVQTWLWNNYFFRELAGVLNIHGEVEFV